MSPPLTFRFPKEGSTAARLANREHRPVGVKQIEQGVHHGLHGFSKSGFGAGFGHDVGDQRSVGPEIGFSLPKISHHTGGGEDC